MDLIWADAAFNICHEGSCFIVSRDLVYCETFSESEHPFKTQCPS